MPVEINIDLDSEKAHGKIQALRTDLKSLNESLDIDFNVDDDLKDKIDEITNQLKEINVDVDYEDLEKAAALKAMLQGDIETDLNVNTDQALDEIRESLDPGGEGGGIDHSGQAMKFRKEDDEAGRFQRFQERFSKRLQQPRGADGSFASYDYKKNFLDKQRNGGFNKISIDMGEIKNKVRQATGNAQGLQNALDGTGINKIGDPLGVGDYDQSRLDRMDGLNYKRRWANMPIDRMNPDFEVGNRGGMFDSILSGGRGKSKKLKQFKGFKKKLTGLIPSMSVFYSIFAAVVPVLAVAATQLMGVAAAMGAVAVAGGAMVGLGLLGHGEDMASSWEKAKEQLSELKEELFATFQPTMQTFAPIQAKVFDRLPEELNEVARAMEGLTAYSDTLFAALSGVTDFIADGFRGMVKYEGILSQLAMRFGEIAGNNIASFFKFVVEQAYNSQDSLIALGKIVKDLLSAFYNVSFIVTTAIAAMRPLAGVVAWIAKLLNNKLIIGIITFSATLAVTIYTVLTLVKVTTLLAAIWSKGLLMAIIGTTKRLAGYIFQTIAASVANNALAASIANVVAFATLGIGALMGMAAAANAVNSIDTGVDVGGPGGGAGSGFSAGGGPGAGGGSTQTVINEGNTYNMEVNGNVDNPTEQGLRDIVSSEGEVSASRGYPEPGGA